MTGSYHSDNDKKDDGTGGAMYRLFDGQPAGGGVNHGPMVIERLKVIMLKN